MVVFPFRPLLEKAARGGGAWVLAMDLGGWFPDLPLGSLCRAVATSGSGGPPWCLGGSVTNGWSGVETRIY